MLAAGLGCGDLAEQRRLVEFAHPCVRAGIAFGMDGEHDARVIVGIGRQACPVMLRGRLSQ